MEEDGTPKRHDSGGGESTTDRHHRSERRDEGSARHAPSRSKSRSRDARRHQSAHLRSNDDREHRHWTADSGRHSGRDHFHRSSRRSRSRSRSRRRSRSLDRYGSRRRAPSRSRSRSQGRYRRRSASLDSLEETRKRRHTASNDRRSAFRESESRRSYRPHRDWDYTHDAAQHREGDRDRRRRSRSRDRSSRRSESRQRDRPSHRQRRQQERERQQQNASAEQQPSADADVPSGSPNRDRSNNTQSSDRQPGKRGARAGGRGKRKGKNSIPDNWEDVAKMGDLIRDSRFVPMRCPLDEKFTHLYKSPDDAWSPQLFVQEQEAKGYNIRMVIDLTNTFKYYDGSAVFEGTPIEYVKLRIEGFNAPPREDEVAKFISIVDAFVEREPTGNIAVHCTHGLNRTGYLVVNYLVKKQGCTVKHALESFTLARPPGLIKHMYVEALYRNLGEGEEVELPVLPEWAADKYNRRR